MNEEKDRQDIFPSELRFDVSSKDWVVIATGRAKKPEVFKKEKKKSEKIPKKGCPFCQIETQETPTVIFANGERIYLDEKGNIPDDWTTIIVPNKYPAFIPSDKIERKVEGDLYEKINAVGFHEVIITRDHDKPIALLTLEKVEELIEVYYTRYLELMNKPSVSYVAIFHNHGSEAGASIYHPHSQIITMPFLDTDLRTALLNSERYFEQHGKCVYCEMSKWEQKAQKRIVFENEDFLVICPFASKVAFQMIISPKKHSSNFYTIEREQRKTLAEAFKAALYKLYKGLNNPAYNFYLHTTPCDAKDYPFYHWHWTILPRTAIHAGFELGVGIEISTIEPERAAEYLKNQ